MLTEIQENSLDIEHKFLYKKQKEGYTRQFGKLRNHWVGKKAFPGNDNWVFVEE